MEEQLTIFPEPGKTYLDYPRIDYRLTDMRSLLFFLGDYQSRSSRPLTNWDKKFAHLHVQAIVAELQKRKETP